MMLNKIKNMAVRSAFILPGLAWLLWEEWRLSRRYPPDTEGSRVTVLGGDGFTVDDLALEPNEEIDRILGN